MPFNPQNCQFSIGEHHGKNVIFAHFQYSLSLKNNLREKFPAAKRSMSKQCRYLPDVNSIRNETGMMPVTETGKAVIYRIHPVNQPTLKQVHGLLLLKGYTPNTVRTYCTEFARMLYILKDTPVDTLTRERLRSYFLYCNRFETVGKHDTQPYQCHKILLREGTETGATFRDGNPAPSKKKHIARSFQQGRYFKTFCPGQQSETLSLIPAIPPISFPTHRVQVLWQ